MQAKTMYLSFKGDQQGAAQLQAALRPLVAGASLAEVVAWNTQLNGQVAALAGSFDAAFAQLAEVMALAESGTPAVESSAWATRVGLWGGNPERVRQGAMRMRELRLPGRVVAASRADTQAALLASEGRTDEALIAYRLATSNWRDLDITLSLALCLTDMAVSLPRTQPEVAAAEVEARELWTRLGSPPLLARLDQPVYFARTGAPRPARDEVDVPVERSARA
jgi:hypothetical protein